MNLATFYLLKKYRFCKLYRKASILLIILSSLTLYIYIEHILSRRGLLIWSKKCTFGAFSQFGRQTYRQFSQGRVRPVKFTCVTCKAGSRDYRKRLFHRINARNSRRCASGSYQYMRPILDVHNCSSTWYWDCWSQRNSHHQKPSAAYTSPLSMRPSVDLGFSQGLARSAVDRFTCGCGIFASFYVSIQVACED